MSTMSLLCLLCKEPIALALVQLILSRMYPSALSTVGSHHNNNNNNNSRSRRYPPQGSWSELVKYVTSDSILNTATLKILISLCEEDDTLADNCLILLALHEQVRENHNKHQKAWINWRWFPDSLPVADIDRYEFMVRTELYRRMAIVTLSGPLQDYPVVSRPLIDRGD